MGKFSLLLIVALSLSGCELSGGPGGPEEAGAGLVILLPGAEGRAIDDPGNIGHEAVQRLLTYEISLAGPGGRTMNRAAAYGESLEFANLEAGEWILSANAFFRGHGNLQANDPASAKPEAQPKTLMLAAAETQEVPLSLDLAPALEQVVLIPDAATFKMIGDPPAAGGWFGEAKNFLLLADLVLDNWKGPAIQGDAYSSPQARAFFHGGGHTLTIRSFETAGGTLNCGLFTDAYLADFYDLKIVLDISAGNSTLVNYAAGGLTATGSNVTVKDVHVSGTLHVRYADTSGAWGGGIAGEITGGMVAASSSKLDLKMEYNGMGSSLGSSAGGLLGEMNGVEITESFFSGTVEGSRAGGILGAEGIFPASDPNIIKHCYSAGTVRGINPNGQAV
ncbi:MAG: hypothetical protein LBH26_02025, partial [Treponema sp.]|nr:hypothetical protein [Treponema sp.]